MNPKLQNKVIEKLLNFYNDLFPKGVCYYNKDEERQLQDLIQLKRFHRH